MAGPKPIKLQKRIAMGDKGVDGMRKGGAVRKPEMPTKKGGRKC